ncbi:membrane protein [Beggiatoa sp. PS]|nr:membrane protein [Beggiatoa sp. PS]
MKTLELLETEKLFHCSLCDGHRFFKQIQIYLAYSFIVSIICGVAHAILVYYERSEFYFFVMIGVISAIFLSFSLNDTTSDDARLYEYKIEEDFWSNIKFKYLYVSIDALGFLILGYFLYSFMVLGIPCEITQVKTFLYVEEVTWLLVFPVICLIIRNIDEKFYCISIVNTCGNQVVNISSYYVIGIILSEFVKINFISTIIFYPVCKLIDFYLMFN